jgi:hypothetical protein
MASRESFTARFLSIRARSNKMMRWQGKAKESKG